MADAAEKAISEIMGAGAQIGDPAIIGMLEQTLMLARQGKVGSIAVLQVTPTGNIGMQVAGSNIPALVVAAVQVEKMLTDQLFNKRGPSLMVPNGRG